MENLTMGSQAPEFSLPASTGGSINLADYQGKWVIIFFIREYN